MGAEALDVKGRRGLDYLLGRKCWCRVVTLDLERARDDRCRKMDRSPRELELTGMSNIVESIIFGI